MRLVDADALKACIFESYEQLRELYDSLERNDEKRICAAERTTFLECAVRVEKAPTIEAEPVRHGRWVHDDLGHTYCSECHERIPYIHCYSDEPNSDWDEEWDEEMPESAYCSHCGAKMDKEEEATCD